MSLSIIAPVWAIEDRVPIGDYDLMPSERPIFTNIDDIRSLSQRISDTLDSVERRNANFSDKIISNVKQLSDFSGNTYYIVEFEPFGYIIFDNRFTAILELNAWAESPYLNKYYGLIYAGATQYYIKPTIQPRNGDSLFVHAVLGTELVVSPTELKLLQDASDSMYEAISKSVEATLHEEAALKESNGVAPLAIHRRIVDLNQWWIITGADTGGFNQGGNCGYVGAALVVWYHRQASITVVKPYFYDNDAT